MQAERMAASSHILPNIALQYLTLLERPLCLSKGQEWALSITLPG
jgi:hypothetical protein